MYGPPGTAYVYFTYGMHDCFNVVCGKVDEPVAVLIRAILPVDGLDTMRRHRAVRPTTRGKTAPRKGPLRDEALGRGPAALCRALSITTVLSGLDLTTSGAMFIERGTITFAERAAVQRTARIGIGNAGEWTAKPYRWVVNAPRAT